MAKRRAEQRRQRREEREAGERAKMDRERHLQELAEKQHAVITASAAVGRAKSRHQQQVTH